MRLCDFVDRDYRHQSLLSMETNVISHRVCCLSKSLKIKSVMWASVLVIAVLSLQQVLQVKVR